MLPLPTPKRTGKIDDLWSLLPIRNNNSRILILAWLLELFNPNGAYPILILDGVQGSGKSITTRTLKSLVDPSKAVMRSLPKDERDLLLNAKNSFVLAFDNISTITDSFSDSLCRISTGYGFSTRTLFSDTDETIISVKRPVILNGIDQVVTRHDLLDRAIIISLEKIQPKNRITEHQLNQIEVNIMPRILGLLLEAVSLALKNSSITSLEKIPRMADFVHWVCSGIPALGISKEKFLEVYNNNRLEAIDEALQSDFVASGIMMLMNKVKTWKGSAADLIEVLLNQSETNLWNRKDIPSDPSILGKRLRRIMSFLETKNIIIDCHRNAVSRTITITHKLS